MVKGLNAGHKLQHVHSPIGPDGRQSDEIRIQNNNLTNNLEKKHNSLFEARKPCLKIISCYFGLKI